MSIGKSCVSKVILLEMSGLRIDLFLVAINVSIDVLYLFLQEFASVIIFNFTLLPNEP